LPEWRETSRHSAGGAPERGDLLYKTYGSLSSIAVNKKKPAREAGQGTVRLNTKEEVS